MATSKIRVLNDHTINKIAAGEVIENPASVVKELVENALDAGASHICVEIQEGGRQLIRISDDGCGMSRDDALLCLERHATSKIREVEDIQELITMGFRGEALPSIASISKLTLLTCPRPDEGKQAEATLVTVDGGRLISSHSSTRSPGTTFEVKSLFFNVPVRRKFQKSPIYDTQEILKMLGRLALAYPDVQFELISDQKALLKTPLSASEHSFQERLAGRLESVLGKEFTSALVPLKFHLNDYEIKGYIGAPSFHKPNRMGQYLFINQRMVTSPLISAAVREGYSTMLPNLRYPVFVLHLQMPGSLLDVNVHPQKKEVRLRQEYQLKEAIIQSVQTALRQDAKHAPSFFFEGVRGNREERADGIDENGINRGKEGGNENEDTPPFWGTYASLLSPSNRSSSVSEEKWEYRTFPNHSLISPEVDDTVEDRIKEKIEKNMENRDFGLPAWKPMDEQFPHLGRTATEADASESFVFPEFEKKTCSVSVVATLLGYCILDPYALPDSLLKLTPPKREGGLALLDQRAAYARIYFEKLVKQSSSQETQALLIPITLQLSPSESHAMQQHASLLNQMGFGLREFGENCWLIDSYPSFLKQEQLATCLNLLIQDLEEMHSSRRLHLEKEKQLAAAASRASLPSNKRLSLEEAQGLIQQLLLCEIPAQCPQGKPTCIYLTPDEIAKWFLLK